MKSNLIDIRRSFVAEKVNRGNYLLMFCTYVSNVFNIQFEELRNNLMSLSLGLFYFFYIGFCFEKVFTLLLFFVRMSRTIPTTMCLVICNQLKCFCGFLLTRWMCKCKNVWYTARQPTFWRFFFRKKVVVCSKCEKLLSNAFNFWFATYLIIKTF